MPAFLALAVAWAPLCPTYLKSVVQFILLEREIASKKCGWFFTLPSSFILEAVVLRDFKGS